MVGRERERTGPRLPPWVPCASRGSEGLCGAAGASVSVGAVPGDGSASLPVAAAGLSPPGGTRAAGGCGAPAALRRELRRQVPRGEVGTAVLSDAVAGPPEAPSVPSVSHPLCL